jgi:hypothetical protein
MLPLDQGTIILMNKVAARGPPLPKNLKMIFKGVEVEDEGGADNGDKAMQDRYDTGGLKIVSDAGSSLPDGMGSEPTAIDYGVQDIIGIHDSIDTVTDYSQQLEPPQDVSEAHVPEAECDVGTSDTGVSAVEPRPVVERPYPSITCISRARSGAPSIAADTPSTLVPFRQPSHDRYVRR